MPWQFGLFGGHVEPGEALIACAVREFEEETQIRIAPEELIPRIKFVSPTNDRMLHYVFELTRRISPSDVVVHEGAGFAFLDILQFDDFPILPSARIAARELAKQ